MPVAQNNVAALEAGQSARDAQELLLKEDDDFSSPRGSGSSVARGGRSVASSENKSGSGGGGDGGGGGESVSIPKAAAAARLYWQFPGKLCQDGVESAELREAVTSLDQIDEVHFSISPPPVELLVASAVWALFNLGREGVGGGRPRDGPVDAATLANEKFALAKTKMNELDFMEQIRHFHLDPVTVVEQYVWGIAVSRKLLPVVSSEDFAPAAIVGALSLSSQNVGCLSGWILALYTYAAALAKVSPRAGGSRAKQQQPPQQQQQQQQPPTDPPQEKGERRALCIVAEHSCGWKFSQIVKDYDDAEVIPQPLSMAPGKAAGSVAGGVAEDAAGGVASQPSNPSFGPPTLFRRLKLLKTGGTGEGAEAAFAKNMPKRTPKEAALWRRYWQLGGVTAPAAIPRGSVSRGYSRAGSSSSSSQQSSSRRQKRVAVEPESLMLHLLSVELFNAEMNDVAVMQGNVAGLWVKPFTHTDAAKRVQRLFRQWRLSARTSTLTREMGFSPGVSDAAQDTDYEVFIRNYA
jgi:hypothetical protein